MMFDHSKVGNEQLFRFADVDEVDIIYSDTGLDDATAARLEEQGPRVVRVELPHQIPTPRELEAIAVEAASDGACVVRAAAGDWARSNEVDADRPRHFARRRRRAGRSERSWPAAHPTRPCLARRVAKYGGSSGIGWIVDPIDGTVNLTYDLPVMSVSIAATVDGEIVAGAVVDIQRGDVFSAARGDGARLDGTAIEPSAATELADSLIGTGFSYTSEGRASGGRVPGLRCSPPAATSGASGRPRSTSAGSRAGASTASTSATCSTGTSQQARSSRRRLARPSRASARRAVT